MTNYVSDARTASDRNSITSRGLPTTDYEAIELLEAMGIPKAEPLFGDASTAVASAV